MKSGKLTGLFLSALLLSTLSGTAFAAVAVCTVTAVEGYTSSYLPPAIGDQTTLELDDLERTGRLLEFRRERIPRRTGAYVNFSYPPFRPVRASRSTVAYVAEAFTIRDAIALTPLTRTTSRMRITSETVEVGSRRLRWALDLVCRQ